MRPWAKRPRETAHLLNPAFCCAAITAAVGTYSSRYPEGVPFPLTFMFLPIVLHRVTREQLPRTARTSVPVWIQQHAEAKVLFAERTIALKPITQEALLFGIQNGWLTLQDGHVQTMLASSAITALPNRCADEARECLSRAIFLGKWFASAGSAYTLMALWGIRP
jgi:hypothetical protein